MKLFGLSTGRTPTCFVSRKGRLTQRIWLESVGQACRKRRIQRPCRRACSRACTSVHRHGTSHVTAAVAAGPPPATANALARTNSSALGLRGAAAMWSSVVMRPVSQSDRQPTIFHFDARSALTATKARSTRAASTSRFQPDCGLPGRPASGSSGSRARGMLAIPVATRDTLPLRCAAATLTSGNENACRSPARRYTEAVGGGGSRTCVINSPGWRVRSDRLSVVGRR